MYATDTPGVATSSFTCSANGTCQGTTQATQKAFIALQTQINRLAPAFGVTKLSVDGKLGPVTLRSLLNLTLGLSKKLGSNLDRALEDLLIETGAPTTTRDVAINAEAITSALIRDGAAEAPWSVLTAIKDSVATVVATGAAAPTAPVPANANPATVIDPYSSPTVPHPGSTPPPPTTPNWWYYNPAAGEMPTPAAARAGVPGWLIGLGVGAVGLIGGVALALSKR